MLYEVITHHRTGTDQRDRYVYAPQAVGGRRHHAPIPEPEKLPRLCARHRDGQRAGGPNHRVRRFVIAF